MSNEENPDEYNVTGDAEFKGKKTVVKVNIDKDAIKEEIKQELGAEKRLDEGLKHFEALKEMAISQHRELEDQINSCETPGQIMEILEQAKIEKPTEKKRAPAGKSTMLPPSNAEQYGSQSEMIDALYEQAYGVKSTAEEKTEARKKINSLWRSFETGKSASLLRESQSNLEKIMKPVGECPNCWRTLIPPLSKNNPECEFCGYNVQQKNDGRRGTSIQPHEHTKTGAPPR
jgi:hypothetical protein